MPENSMYPSHVPYRAMRLEVYRTQGRLVFGTPAEREATPRVGAARWSGVVAVTEDGLGQAYEPGMPEEFMDGPAFNPVTARVRAEGTLYNAA